MKASGFGIDHALVCAGVRDTRNSLFRLDPGIFPKCFHPVNRKSRTPRMRSAEAVIDSMEVDPHVNLEGNYSV